MWFGILLTIFFGYVFARILVNAETDEIIKNWKEYRCRPHVMLFANFFKNKDDPRSDSDFTSNNFEFCSSEIAKEVLQTVLKPVMTMFYQMSNSAIQSIGVTMNLRTLGANLFNGLNRVFDIFARRFNMVIHELRMSFIKQYSAMQKANGIAIASVFQGITVIRAIMNFFNLMIIVCISILVILVLMVIFLFFLLAPAIPLILVTVAVVAAAGGAVGGMSDAFCFSPETEIILVDGVSRIDKIKNGDILKNGAVVNSIIKFKTNSSNHNVPSFWLVDGILVSGSHIMFVNDKPIFVKDYEFATPYTGCIPEYVYCINTSDNKIPVKGLSTTTMFSDWEELDSDNMKEWDALVRELLNNSYKSVNVDTTYLDEETGFDVNSTVNTKFGFKKLSEISVGDTIFDGFKWTEVVGIVETANNTTFGLVRKLRCSGATWIKENNVWIRASESKDWLPTSPVSNSISLFTKSGKFFLNGEHVRDFSDVGLENIHKTYKFTLNSLLQKCS